MLYIVSYCTEKFVSRDFFILIKKFISDSKFLIHIIYNTKMHSKKQWSS